MTAPEENEALVRRYLDEVYAGSIDVVDEVFAAEFTTGTDVVRSDLDVIDTDAMKAVWREYFEAFPDMTLETHEVVAEGNTVVSIQVSRGTHEGEFRGIEPTGNEVVHEIWSRFVVEDGEIVHGDAQADNFGLFTQLGLELSIEGYRTLIDTAPDPIVIADVESGAVVETNEATEAILERPREDIIGRHQRALHPDDREYGELFETAAERAREQPVELSRFPDGANVELERADGSRIPVEIGAQVVTLAEVTTLVSIYRDVSDRRRRKQRLQVLNRVLRHNLRNDLGVVEALAETMAVDLEGEDAERARRIQARARDLVDLGAKAREIERVTSAETALAENVDVGEVVESAVEAVSDSHPSAAISVEAASDVEVVTARRALALAVENLLENAVEHNDVAQPRAWVRVDRTDGGVEIAVEDDGPGIPEHELAVIEEGGETPLEHGSGIGLWLVHWVSNAIRGEVAFESTETGTRAVLTVPTLDGTVGGGE